MSRFALILAKELRVEARGREMLTGGFLLALLTLIIGHLAFGRLPDQRDAAPGVLWIAFAFASTLALSRSLHRERDRGTWEALAILPVDWGLIFLSKAAANTIVLLVIEGLALAV